jgi:hypothetical protein
VLIGAVVTVAAVLIGPKSRLHLSAIADHPRSGGTLCSVCYGRS